MDRGKALRGRQRFDQLRETSIRADLANSPFKGKGHRKVCARLLRRKGELSRVSNKRVLRVMRAAKLLSPHRLPRHLPNLHDERIATDEPNVRWGTDGIRIETVEDG